MSLEPPISFDAIADVGNGQGKKITVNLISRLATIDLGMFERPEDGFILKLSHDVRGKLDGFNYLINYGDAIGSYIYKEAILYYIINDYYGIIDMNSKREKIGMNVNLFNDDINGNDVEDYKCKILKPIDITKHEVKNFEEIKAKFSMIPPKNIENQPNIVSPEQINEPLPYIKSRYYNILYSTSIPLSYFPKTALSRLRVLCKNESNEIKQTLTRLILNSEAFSSRHDAKYGLLKLISHKNTPGEFELDQLEKSHQLEFINRHDNLKNEELLNELVLELKIREAQLQLLLLLEILVSMNLIELEFLNAKQPEPIKEKVKKVRPSLVRKKNSKRKIIPTFLGMGISSSNNDSNNNNNNNDNNNNNHGNNNSISMTEEVYDSYTMLRMLNDLVEKMNLWDTLSNAKKDTTVSFVSYVLVPYYKNKLPETMNHIVEKIKGSNLKLKSKSRILKPSLSVRKKIERSKLNNEVNNDKLKTLDDKTFAPPMFKRSNSNLSSSKNLHRRQVDFSQPKATKSKSMTDISKHSVPKTIFGVAKRNKSMITSDSNPNSTSSSTSSLTLPPPPSFSQVAATPVKKSKSFSIPIASNQIIDSPIMPNVEVTETPINPTREPKNLNHQLHSLVPDSSPIQQPQFQNNIQLSPVDERSSNKISSELLMSPAPINSSPFLISSERLKRPMEAKHFQDSPFFSSLNGSPLASNKKIEEINIFKRGGTKRRKKDTDK